MTDNDEIKISKKNRKVNLWWESLYATIFILLFMWVLQYSLTHANLEAFDAIGNALSDMEITDYGFSELRDTVPPDDNVVLVNFGPLDRNGIAQQIRIIDKYKPKVIGLDSFFKGYAGDTLATFNLADAINNAKAEVVMVVKVQKSDSLKATSEGEEIFDEWYKSEPIFLDNAHDGMANLDTEAKDQEDIKICRAYPPKRTSIATGESHISFGAKMATLYDSTKLKKYLERIDREFETINFRGDIYLAPFFFDPFSGTLVEREMQDKFMRYQALDADQVLAEDFAPEMIEGKIVIFGYLGEQLGAKQWEDKFFTPLNSKIAGRANPDMYGPVIHANIVSMVLNEDYIDGFSELTEGIMGIILLYINVFLFSIIYHKMDDWYDGITKLIQLLEIIALTILVVYIFAIYSFKMELSIAFFGIALVGDMLEVYYGVVKKLFNKKNKNKLVTFVTGIRLKKE